MNTPAGFDIVAGKFENILPFVAMLNPAGIPEAVHVALAPYTAAGFATAESMARLSRTAEESAAGSQRRLPAVTFSFPSLDQTTTRASSSVVDLFLIPSTFC
jgi:cytochrome bd-type quinol oxidase subunit 1